MSARTPRRALWHAMFWLGALGTNLLMQLPAHFIIGSPLYVGGLFFNQLPATMLAAYPLLYGLLPRLLRGRQLPLWLGLLAVWLLATIVLANLTSLCYDFVLAPRLFGKTPPPLPGVPNGINFLAMNYTWFTLMVTVGAACAIKVMNGWYKRRQRSRRLYQRRLQTELELLKARLQPDFLFDTLRTLRMLTARQAPEAAGAVLHLAGLLRYMLYDSVRAMVPLAEEADMIRHYVALEQLRLARQVEVSLSFSGHFEPHAIAPLLLLPLVENAFQPAPEAAWISIDLVAKPNSLIFKVINNQSGTAEDAVWAEPPGLLRIRQRLAYLYPGHHELKVVAEPDTLLVMLLLRLTPLPPSAAPPIPSTTQQRPAHETALSTG